MIIDIVGAGSLGLLFGGKLQAAGQRVRFWTRTSEQANQLKKNGIIMIDNLCEIHIKPDEIDARPTTELTDTWNKAPGDWILLTIKQTHMKEFIDQINTLNNRHLKIACFQNGIGHLEKLKEALPYSLIYSAITTEGAKRTQEAQVQRAGSGETSLGISETLAVTTDGENCEEQIIALAKVMQQAGFDCTVSNEIDKLVYRKLLINGVINPLTALWRIPNGELLNKKERVRVMRQLYDETLTVYKAMGIQLEGDSWEQVIGVCRDTASNTSSMLADVLHKRTTEVESINGSMIRMAQQFNLEVPTHEVILHLIQGMQSEGVS
ncbi:2-dehydropantoate 2-reductase [Paenibacillus sp. JJ-100]|nr:2-dehydropantoate 2-reductase [Paenibacillus sp. JJ-100]